MFNIIVGNFSIWLETTWACDSTLETVSFEKSKSESSVSDGNLGLTKKNSSYDMHIRLQRCVIKILTLLY